MTIDNTQATGAAAGFLAGIGKGIMTIITTVGFLSWSVVFETCVLAFVGGAVGIIGADLYKWLKNKILKKNE